MGFHEDDRVRQKNDALNKAYEIYQGYLAKQWSNSDIAAEAERRLGNNLDNRVMYEVLKLALAASSASIR